eukprot:TRINITY_DN129_c0_g2_i1.p1 TRINITY_DN129_c0_g2~~TRINITY_DN129_c0_g2_i1.p1  ORF type:complete len:578 (-),score=99.32 TRINITY_DN129_c0_g2_i1:63-1796(-)
MIRILRYAAIRAQPYKAFACKRFYYNSMESFKEFKAAFEKEYVPMYVESNISYWNASLTGKAEDWNKYEESNKKINKYLSNKEAFAKLKSIRDSGKVEEPVTKRELETIYLWYLGYQVDPEKLDKMTTMSANIEKKFNNFRAEYKDKRYTDNDVLDILKTSTDSEELQGVWTAQKKIALEVASDIKELVKIRNEVAKELGFKNYHDMSLRLNEQDPEHILKLFNELDELTKNTFAIQKKMIDDIFAERYKVKKEDLMPWHYHDFFFQKAPKIYKVDYDKYYKGKDLEAITKKFYEGIDLDMSDLLKRSDLYQKEGKCQHAYCLTVDRLGDVRVLCNNVDNHRWMSTMLHEFGHALYDKSIDNTLPFVLREPAHIFTTEAIAMLFERLASKSSWINQAIGIPLADQQEIDSVSNKVFVLNQLVFSRWSQVMFRFEKSMYENPEQDLNNVWWSMVEKYQLLKKPTGRNEPDWAAKIHIASSPCYYHNYLMGELLTSQFNHYICNKILGTENILTMPYGSRKEIGKYLKENVFAPGRLLTWGDMIIKATGEPLTAKYYAKELELALKEQPFFHIIIEKDS